MNYEMIFKRKSFHLFRHTERIADEEIEQLNEYMMEHV